MKVSPKDLANLIREVVQDELRKSLRGAIQECLTESYLRRIVAESTAKGTMSNLERRLSETFVDDVDTEEEDVIPGERYESRSKGIYQKSPLVKNESATTSKLLSKDNPMAFVFEGVQPISNVESGPRPGEVRVDRMAEAGFDFEKMNRLVNLPRRGGSPNDLLEEEDPVMKQKMAELERKRKLLEVKE